jgi:anti-sigma regulatory factor (Ser/Thr protein kinase)
MPSSDLLELRIPADPELVGAVRRFGESIGHQFGTPEEDIRDIELALSEACGALITLREVAPASGPISIQAEVIPPDLVFRIEDLGESSAARAKPNNEAHARISELPVARTDLIRALFTDAVITATEAGRLTIEFRVRWNSSEDSEHPRV